jgi:pimeloyl-ACP methyl ester carboxylesterase
MKGGGEEPRSVPNKYFQIDGVATFVRHTGPSTLPEEPPALGDGRTVLCLHGAGGNGNLFAGLFEALAPGHSLLAFDQPAHGRSGGLDSLGAIDRMASFTRALMDKLGLEHPVLVGHDMGAAVALECALQEPGRLGGLVLCSAGDRFDLSPAALSHALRVSQVKERRPFDPAQFSPDTGPDTLKKAFMEGMKTDPRATYGDLQACRDWAPGDRLSEIRVPARVIHGESELDGVKGRAAALADALSSGAPETIPAAGHALLLEAPEALGACIADFLGGGAR